MHRWIEGFIWPFQGKPPPPPRARAKFKGVTWPVRHPLVPKTQAVRPSSENNEEREARNELNNEEPATMIAQHVIFKTVR